jgi:cbb3-type cytochrome oxidase subunit 3
MFVLLILALCRVCVPSFVLRPAGVDINDAQSAHVSLLTDQSWDLARVLLSFPHKCDSPEKIRLLKTEHLLSQLAQTIRHSRTVLCIWGIPLQANFRNAVLTVTFSVCSSAISYWLRNAN